MIGWGTVVATIDAATHEVTLFAAVGFLIGGIDDLLVDAIFLARRIALRRRRAPVLADFTVSADPGRIVIFVAAWHEAAVIGPMLRNALSAIDHPEYRIYVGTYPNDRETIAAVAAVAAGDPRIRLVIGADDGPTTKGANLNAVYGALLRDEAADGRRVKAVVLHDAEDMVHPGELRVFDALVERHWLVQLPVLPLVDCGLVGSHYADEFAEAHGKQMVVREALGAALPLAGVGCAIARAALDAVAAARGGAPFDGGSLTEDYEFGLHVATLGGRSAFARVAEVPGGPPVAVRAYFPDRLDAAVRQKARWMTGIALAGWDRVGWAQGLAFGDHWMRMRDRRGPIAVLVLAAAYAALVCWGVARGLHELTGTAPAPIAVGLDTLLRVNALLLGWRMVTRLLCTRACYGWRQGLWSLPRAVLGNYIALLAGRRAFGQYLKMLLGAPPRWDKTDHVFPEDPAAAAGR
jgi:adsorption protein B